MSCDTYLQRSTKTGLPVSPGGAPSQWVLQMQEISTCGSTLSPTVMIPERLSTVVLAGCDEPTVPDLAWLSCEACGAMRC